MRRTVLLLLALAPVALADEHANPFAAVEVAPGIYQIGNTNEDFALNQRSDFVGGGVGLLVGDEYVVLIDDVMEPTVPHLVAKAEELAGRPIDFVINTHAHGDHVGGNVYVTEQGALVVSHDKLRERMQGDPQLNTGPGALPVITFSNRMTFHVNGEQAVAIHVPDAHTDGDAIIHFVDANVIATGDLSFRGLFPYIDLDSGGTVTGFKAGLRQLIDMADEDTKFITGHGPVGTRAGLAKDLAMLEDAEARVMALLDKGMSEEDILAANPLADYHDEYNWFFITTEKMTQTFIRSLTQD
ncbi:MAG: MBL fold metallo-hydrolase [Gammaproteobacteria bacterium]|nr:MBL fold metallo-hydrolase [Gammaproteobacteria bacterium]MBT8094675.1 MBL fold metallo-hydrolase [Gammaproteobacteria bacterium]NNF49853.1 MBL fold metallo-hydrolase [Woeseiaceae bacterium]NNL64180.1 MBL fold metallo-hydrolase [Woeseiaceae bacterium]